MYICGGWSSSARVVVGVLEEGIEAAETGKEAGETEKSKFEM
jgi:hypothetical protein